MPETPLPPDSPPPTPPPSGDDAAAAAETREMPSGRGRLVRLRSDRVFAGVASGLGRHFGVDANVVRIAIVVLTFFGGAGALLYLAGMLLVPSEEELAAGAVAPGAPPVGDRNRGLVILGAAVLVVVAGPLLLAPALLAGGLVVPLAFLVVLGLATAWLVTGRRPERDVGGIARATVLGLSVLALVGLLAVGSFWGAGLGGEAVVAGLVIAAGVAVVAAAFARPARWLVLPALALAIPAAFVSAAGIDLDGGIGERSYRPGTPAQLAPQYDVGIGAVTIDLRGVDLPAGDRRLAVDVGMGEAVVIVPEDLCVATSADLGAGQADVFDRGAGGVDVDWLDETSARAGRPRLVLDADIGLGHLDVRTTTPRNDWASFDEDWDRRDWDRWRDERRGVNDACAA